MKTGRKKPLLEKASVKDSIWALKGIRIPVFPLVLIFTMAMLSTYASMNISLFTGNMVDASGNVPTSKLLSFTGAYLLIGAAAAGAVIASALASEKINLGLRIKLWRKIMYTKQSCYENDTGESLVSRVTSDCDFASRIITTLVQIAATAVTLVVYTLKMNRLNHQLTVAMLWLVPVTLLFGWVYAKLHFIIAQKTQAMLSDTTTYLVEHTQKLNLIKISGTQALEIEKGLEHFDRQYDMQFRAGLMSLAYNFMQKLFEILSLLIPFIIGAQLVSDRVIRVGIVIAFYSMARSVGTVATTFINYVGTIRQANGALARVIRVLRLPDERDSSGLSMDIPDQDITIEELFFSYGEKTVLDNVSCSIPKHRITALIGSNGSGKSTLFKLIDRLIEPSGGRLTFGGRSIDEYDLFEWRKTFCLVLQGSPLIEGTLRENICYGCKRRISQDELDSVLKQAHLEALVAQLPDGLDTMVTMGGANFSGGQRQCIAIARAIMNNPDYLLLDEATCSLDAHSEHTVMEALTELMKGRTTIIIAHSLSAIRNTDHVIILNNGKISGTGSPEQIMQTTENYLSKVANRTLRCRM